MVEVVQNQNYLSKFIDDIINNVKLHNLSDIISDVDSKLDLLKLKIDALQQRTTKTIKEEIYDQYEQIEQDTNILMIELNTTPIIKDISMELMQIAFIQKTNLNENSTGCNSDRNTSIDQESQSRSIILKEDEIDHKHKELDDIQEKNLSEQEVQLQANEEKKAQVVELNNQSYIDNTIINSKQNMQKIAKAEKAYNMIKGTKSKFDKNFKLVIDANHPSGFKILKHAKDVKFPAIKQLKIDKPSEVPTLDLKSMLKYSFTQPIELFCFNYNTKMTYINIKNYLDLITPIIEKTTKEVYINVAKMDYDEFSRIVKASKNCQRLIFRGLRFIKSGTIQFGRDIDYNIKFFSVFWSGHSTYNNWAVDDSQLRDIVKEIKQSNMEKQLQTFDIHQC